LLDNLRREGIKPLYLRRGKQPTARYSRVRGPFPPPHSLSLRLDICKRPPPDPIVPHGSRYNLIKALLDILCNFRTQWKLRTVMTYKRASHPDMPITVNSRWAEGSLWKRIMPAYRYCWGSCFLAFEPVEPVEPATGCPANRSADVVHDMPLNLMHEG